MATVCSNCGFHNPPGMRFCGNCGTRLAESVRLPGDSSNESALSVDQPAVRPEQLGVLTGADLLERFKKAGLEARGQRRSVTVLFVDLTGYTHLSAALGDEELYELVQKFIQLLVNDVYKYEGMVDKLTGDGLMALFGAPIAHENNAERALRSALDMVADVERLEQELAHEMNLHGHTLRIHVGLNAGSVIVGGLGGDGLMNYTAVGDSVNLARRLEEAAGPGEIIVSESVYRQTNRLFDFEHLPPLSLKNIPRQVIAYRIVGEKERPGSVRGLEGLRAPMIGRENEYNQAFQMVDRLVNDHRGGIVLLVGEGGMGKSRLTSELKMGLDFTRVRLLEGQSLTYRKSIAYWIFQVLFRSYLDVTVETSEKEFRRKLSEHVSSLFEDDGIEKLAYLEYMLSLEPSDLSARDRIKYLTASQLRQQIFLAVRDLLIAEAARNPLMLILEDLHWADDASLDLIRFLADSTRVAPLLIFAISRPFEGGAVQTIHEHASQRLSDRYLYLRLQALPPERSAELLQALLTIQDLPESLRVQIIQRSAGLPFYLEEILRMLIENKVIYLDRGAEGGYSQWRVSPGADPAAIGVPETLQGLILARFDRLSPFQRRVLQTASVIGYQFDGAVLHEVIALQKDEYSQADIEETLAYLVEHEFIIPVVRESAAADSSFNFRHVLVSDAVYSTLLQRDRREMHTRTGQAIEKLYSDRLDAHIEVLAGHYLRSPLLDRALHYLTLAGQKAARSYANEQARVHFSQAIEVLDKVPHTVDQEVDVVLGLGDVLLTAGDYADSRDYFRRGLDALQKTYNGETGSSRVKVSYLLRKVSQTQESQGNYEEAVNCLKSAQKLLIPDDENRYASERANTLSDIGWIHFRRGALEQAENAMRQALELAEICGQPDVLATVYNRQAGIFFQRDDPEQAADYLAKSLVLRERIGDVVGVARLFNNLGLIGWKQGDLNSALQNFNHAFRMQSKLGDVEGIISLHTNMGLIELDLGDLQEAEHHFQEALRLSTQIGHSFHINEARMHLALLNVFLCDWRRTLEHGLLGLAGFQDLGIQENLLDLYVSLGWAYMGLGDEAHLEEVVQHIREMLNDKRDRHESISDGDENDNPSEGKGRAYRLFGRLAQRNGLLYDARRAFIRSSDIFIQVGNPLERARVLVDLAVLLHDCGEEDQSRVTLKEATEIFERMDAKLELERVKTIKSA